MGRGLRRGGGLRRALLGCVTVLALIAGGAASAAGPAAAAAVPSSPGSFPGYQATLARYAAQPVDWWQCDPSFECADITLPRDWHHPENGDIQTDITRVRATGTHRRGILLTNPGGPGDFGYWVPAYLASVEPDLNAVYDIIGMDPRGTWDTTLDCVDPAIFQPAFAVDNRDLRPPAITQTLGIVRQYGHTCTKDPLTRYVNTDQTARDLDLVRALLGEKKMSYVGYSAGTYLGAWFATLFPDRVDRMVFDGNVDYTRPWHDTFGKQPQAFQRVFDRVFVPWLAANNSTYHLGATGAAVKHTYESRRAALVAHPVTLPDGTALTANQVDSGLSGGLLDTAFYPSIGSALAALEHLGTASPDELDLIASWFPPLEWSANANVNEATVCNDTPTPAFTQIFVQGIQDTLHYPLAAGGGWANACNFWSLAPNGSPVTGRGLPNLLMLQDDGDPATPISGAAAAHAATPGSVMVTVKHQDDHTIYGEGDPCVEQIANTWLIGGRLPAHDTTCAGIPLPSVSTGGIAARVGTLATTASQSMYTWMRTHGVFTPSAPGHSDRHDRFVGGLQRPR
jgi:pimeloyl-ACP methyl ester carboxylesterase